MLLMQNFKASLIIGIIVITGFLVIISEEARSGGSRGGGSRSSRSGSSRSSSGFRSSVRSRGVSYNKIKVSVRYSSWSRSHGLSSSFRYRSSSYSYKRTGIITGLIIMSDYQRRTFADQYNKSYNDISICYNEFPLYDRNVSISPWFVCPWKDPRYRYCCGDEIEERCCRYFDRPGHLAGLIIGVIILCALIYIVIKYCHVMVKHCRRSCSKVVYKHDSPKTAKLDNNPIIYTENLSNLPYPTYNDLSMEYQPEFPPQYPVDPQNPGTDYVEQPMPTYVSDESNQHFPLLSPENPPPSYSEIKNYE